MAVEKMFPNVDVVIAHATADVDSALFKNVDIYIHENWVNIRSNDEQEQWWYPRDSGIVVRFVHGRDFSQDIVRTIR